MKWIILPIITIFFLNSVSAWCWFGIIGTTCGQDSDLTNSTNISIVQTSEPYLKIYSGADSKEYNISLKDKEVCFLPLDSKTSPSTLSVETDLASIELTKTISLDSKEQYCYTIDKEEYLKLNPTIVNQEESMIQFIDDDLIVNNTLRKWNGEEFVISPEDIWIREPEGDNFKFGANDTISKEDTLYQYEWISNKEIKQDKKGYYYFEEFKNGETGVSNIYTRRILDVSDVCSKKCIEYDNESSCINMNYPNCVYSLNNLYDENETLINSKLLMNFTGFYNETLDMVFIDPSYSYTNTSTSITLGENIRSEPTYSHLAINDTGLILYMSFDVEHGSNNITYDYTSNDNDGTLYNPVFNTSGKYGGNYKFNGISSYITAGDIDELDNSNEISGCVWVYHDSITSADHMILSDDTGLNGGFLLQRDDIAGESSRTDTYVLFAEELVGSTACQLEGATNASQLNTWTHVCFTLETNSATGARLYINGIEDANSPDSTLEIDDFDSGSQLVRIGHHASLNRYFNGNIDEVMLFDRVLSADEVAQIYNSTYQKFYKDGNQTFELENVSLGSDNRVNVTVEGESLNDSSLNARVYEASYDSVINDNLVLYMHMDNLSEFGENDTYVYDFSGNGNNGTVTGANVTTSGKFDGAYEFDGDDDIISIANDVSLQINGGAFTASAWIYQKQQTNEYDTIISKDNLNYGDQFPWTICTYGNDFHLRVGNTTAVISVSKADILLINNWHHVVGTFDPNQNMSVYVDGIKQSTIDVSGSTFDSSSGTNPLKIGILSYINAWEFNGTIDEVMIFNRSLSADEIKSLYLTGSTNHKNNGDGINWTESSTGQQELTTYNDTHLKASDFVINSGSDYLLTEIGYNSTNGFYSGNLKNINIDTYEVGGEPPDTIYPIFSNYWDNNATLTDSGTGLFNVTVINTNGTVLLEVDGNNITATNSSSIYNVSYDFTSSGNYEYKWHSWGNGTSENYNVSETRYYYVNSSSSCTCPDINNNWEINLEDDCSIQDACDIGNGNITFINTGTITFNNTITACQIGSLPANQKGYLGSLARIIFGGSC